MSKQKSVTYYLDSFWQGDRYQDRINISYQAGRVVSISKPISYFGRQDKFKCKTAVTNSGLARHIDSSMRNFGDSGFRMGEQGVSRTRSSGVTGSNLTALRHELKNRLRLYMHRNEAESELYKLGYRGGTSQEINNHTNAR